MVYLLDKLDPELFEHDKRYALFWFWETTEDRVKAHIQNERTRAIVEKKEIVNMFDIKQKVQITPIDKIRLRKFDKVILWTESKKYYIMEVTDFKS